MLPLTLSQFVGLFNIFVGLMLVASVLLMGAGFVMWVVRLGNWNTYRDEAIDVMMWGVAVLLSLIILVLLSQFVQQHTATAVFVLGLFIIAGIAYLAWTMFKQSQASEDDH